mmetsp:Transcript_15310/g.43634  ORF Transcript_15310/g.43634 Transcript_15310/m.43634 type:complete len:240 (-) Transcript_15310:891-1610(-)
MSSEACLIAFQSKLSPFGPLGDGDVMRHAFVGCFNGDCNEVREKSHPIRSGLIGKTSSFLLSLLSLRCRSIDIGDAFCTGNCSCRSLGTSDSFRLLEPIAGVFRSPGGIRTVSSSSHPAGIILTSSDAIISNIVRWSKLASANRCRRWTTAESSSPSPSLPAWKVLSSHGSFSASLAVGRCLGSLFNNLLTKAFASLLTVSHSFPVKDTSSVRILRQTTDSAGSSLFFLSSNGSLPERS